MTTETAADSARTETPPPERTALYRLYGSSGELIYVGITGNPEKRFGEHAAKPWWRRVTRREVEWYGSRKAASLAEEATIKIRQPLENISHNPVPPVMVEVPVPRHLVTGLDMLCRELLGGQPNCSRSTALIGLLIRELSARGLDGDPHCFHSTCASWPDGMIVPEPCGRCFCAEPAEAEVT